MKPRAAGTLVQLRPEARRDDLTDEGVVAACATGDRAARALLFERHVDVVHRFIRRMRASDAPEVDDLVQATFLTAFQSAARFRGGHVRGWLYGIAANHVRMYARGEIRRKHALQVVSETASRSHVRAHAELLARLPAAIAALPHDLRAAFVLVDLEGERGCDAAAALGIPEGSLWRRVFHARKALRDALGDEPTDGCTTPRRPR
ncbi:MAG TPA: sigma-70 family RNA polymerase sigma factor [Kofleriaceae bacterium]|nr:sigma-70 family RNA polymerase sigma factor [Kofleriaceae bacterium]